MAPRRCPASDHLHKPRRYGDWPTISFESASDDELERFRLHAKRGIDEWPARGGCLDEWRFQLRLIRRIQAERVKVRP